jgi:hypothetical protein
MKIYIKNYNPMNILKKIKLIDEYFYSMKNSTEIISEEGIFYIDDNKFYKINVILDELVEFRIKTYEILLDKTIYNKNLVHQLPSDHNNSHITSFYYSINQKSKIKLVIEGEYKTIYKHENNNSENNNSENNNSENNNEIINKYKHFYPINFYFEAPNEKTEFEILNNDDLNVFLSLLN